MIKVQKVYELFFISVLCSPFLGYFFKISLVTYGPLILMMLLVFLLEAISQMPMRGRDWWGVFIWMPYVFLGIIYYLWKPLGAGLSSHLLVFMVLPFLTVSAVRLRFYCNRYNFNEFSLGLIYLFSIGQLIICAGQVSTYLTGVGLPINAEYESYFMVSGTFYNGNDLSAAILILGFILISIQAQITTGKQVLAWALIFTLVAIGGSRAAMALLLCMFLVTRRLQFKTLIPASLAVVISFLYLILMVDAGNPIVDRFIHRLDTLLYVLEHGVGEDGSMSLRLDSYLHFLKNFGNLGFGSGELNNYFKYSDGANFPTDLMFQNPHSLLVELGYWMGWFGLVFFAFPMLYLLGYVKRKIWFIVVFLVATIIPSSILGGVVYFLFIVVAFFAGHEYEEDQKVAF